MIFPLVYSNGVSSAYISETLAKSLASLAFAERFSSRSFCVAFNLSSSALLANTNTLV